MASSHQLMVIPLEAQRESKNIEVDELAVVKNFSKEGNFGLAVVENFSQEGNNFGFLFVVYCLPGNLLA